MIEHIIREAVPALRAFQDQPTPQRFKVAMVGLLEALNEDAKHTGNHGAWAQFAQFTPPVTKPMILAWIAAMPEDAPRVVAAILARLQKLGIDLRSSGKAPPPPPVPPAPLAMPQAAPPVPSFDAVFGNPMTTVAAANAAQAMAQSQFAAPGLPVPALPPGGGYAPAADLTGQAAPSLQQRMERLTFQDLMDAALRWQPDQGVPPLTFARFLLATRDRLPPDALERVMMPLGVGAEYFHAWCAAAQGHLVAGTQWPDVVFQMRVLRQFLAFFTLVELNATSQHAPQVAYRLFAVGTLLPREDQQRACAGIQQRAPSHGAWVYVTPEVLGAWASGMAVLPGDAALLHTMRAVLADAVYLRFRAAAW